MKLFTSMVAVLIAGLTFTAFARREIMHVQYRRIATYQENQELLYPDFTLRFLGKSDGGKLSNGVPLGARYTFEATKGQETVPIVWSSGGGEVTGRLFSIGAKKFVLEKMFSPHAVSADNSSGQLQENQFVISESAI